jgi:methylglyoxal synthase
MNIVLIAQDNRKELMTEFCIAYKNILQNCDLFATGTTGTYIAESTGLAVQKFSPGSLGGEQQVRARIDLNEIDMLIYFRDPLIKKQDYDEYQLFRRCDVYNIPFATNLATAEMLIKALERGDLDWRELVRPVKNNEPVKPLKKVRTRRSRTAAERRPPEAAADMQPTDKKQPTGNR